ncbi:MAG TPA: PP2C family protein-serine/threonine phosphatase [Dongiaceae bacterium]|nr:PP2C family protein-serine/threonine phosphatase [Dongiaceae bacterium]
MNSQSELSDQVWRLIAGTSFVVVGFLTLALSLIRRRSRGALGLFWVGVWAAVYGIQGLNACPALISLLPRWLQECLPYSHAAINYLVLVIANMTFRELTWGPVRRFVSMVALVGLGIAAVGIWDFVFTGNENAMSRYNHLLAGSSLIVLVVFVSVPRLNELYGGFDLGAKSRALLVGAGLFGAEALYGNVGRFFNGDLDTRNLDDLGFAALLLSLGYVSMHRVYAGEMRLSSIENELSIARQLQFSILPTTTPELRNLRIAAVYEPMSAVAGDFYEFLPLDDQRAGFLVADVSGHGVPAALIASMIKLAVKSVAETASDPGRLLHRLREILSGELQGQFVSVAYLWIDTEARRARYSAAGHPPLLFWQAQDCALDRIASNGALIGVPVDGDFPVREITFSPGDRFVLYTDGVSEPENSAGEAFGDRKLEQLLHQERALPAAELSLQLLAQVRAWTPPPTPQPDDITILVIDVL